MPYVQQQGERRGGRPEHHGNVPPDQRSPYGPDADESRNE